jgi:hypothetical protein
MENKHGVAGSEAYDNDTQYLNITDTLFEDVLHLIFNLCISVLFLLDNRLIFEFSMVEIGWPELSSPLLVPEKKDICCSGKLGINWKAQRCH